MLEEARLLALAPPRGDVGVDDIRRTAIVTDDVDGAVVESEGIGEPDRVREGAAGVVWHERAGERIAGERPRGEVVCARVLVPGSLYDLDAMTMAKDTCLACEVDPKELTAFIGDVSLDMKIAASPEGLRHLGTRHHWILFVVCELVDEGAPSRKAHAELRALFWGQRIFRIAERIPVGFQNYTISRSAFGRGSRRRESQLAIARLYRALRQAANARIPSDDPTARESAHDCLAIDREPPLLRQVEVKEHATITEARALRILLRERLLDSSQEYGPGLVDADADPGCTRKKGAREKAIPRAPLAYDHGNLDRLAEPSGEAMRD